MKLKASDGKMRETDCLSTKDVFRLIESIPSKKAEPFKMWLAELGKERGISKSFEYGILTNELTKSWSGLTTNEYKRLKNLKKESLRDNMSEIELFLNQFAELTTRELSKKEEPTNLKENIDIAKKGGEAAKIAKNGYEEITNKKVVTSKNAKDFLNKEIEDKK